MSFENFYLHRHRRVEWFGGNVAGSAAGEFAGVLFTVPTTLRGALIDYLVVNGVNPCILRPDLSFAATVTAQNTILVNGGEWFGGRPGATRQVVVEEVRVDTDPGTPSNNIGRIPGIGSTGGRPSYFPPQGLYIPGGQSLAVINDVANALVFIDYHVIEDQIA